MPPLMMDNIMSPPPSSPPHNPLSIRTAKQHSKQPIQQAPSSSSSQQPYPEYPIKIPLEKQPKALELYITLKLAEMLAQSEPATHNDGYLLAPSTARSVRSQTSSKGHGAPSTSASAYDGMTDYGSVVSFDQSPTSTTEFTSFTGKKVKTRKRKRLTPTARAKAALVRYLGSCMPCRNRRVPCPLDHHDIQCLETLRLSMPKEETRPEPQPSPLSAASSSSQRTATSIPKQEPASSSAVQDAFLGIGAQLPDIDDMDFDTQLDMDILNSGSGENYDNTQAERPAPAQLNLRAPNLPIINPNPYATFQNGALFSLGCFRDGKFLCQHLQLCQQRLDTADDLQNHFAIAHFEYTRIDPAHRYICSMCHFTSLFPNDPCSCGTADFIELWICGHFIRRQWYQRDSSDGTDFQGYRPGSNFDSPSYGRPNINFPWDPNMDGGNFGGGGNHGQFNNYQGGNSYGMTGNQRFGWNNSNGSGSGSNQYQGNFGARQMTWDGQYSFQIWCWKAQQKGRPLKSLLLLLLLLLAFTFSFTYLWIFTKARMAIPQVAASIRSHLPVLGFVILLSAIAMCPLIRRFTFKRARCVSITIILDHLAQKHADDVRRDLDFLCTGLHSLLYRLHAGQSDLNMLCVVSLAYDKKREDDYTLMPSMKHELQRPP